MSRYTIGRKANVITAVGLGFGGEGRMYDGEGNR